MAENLMDLLEKSKKESNLSKKFELFLTNEFLKEKKMEEKFFSSEYIF